MTQEQAKEYFNNHGCCCPFGTSPFNCEDKDCRFGQAIRAFIKGGECMTNEELRQLVHLLLICGITDKLALDNGIISNDEWLEMMKLIDKYQANKLGGD